MSDRKLVPGLIVKKFGLVSATTQRISTLDADVYNEAGQQIGAVELDQMVEVLKHHGFEVVDVQAALKRVGVSP